MYFTQYFPVMCGLIFAGIGAMEMPVRSTHTRTSTFVSGPVRSGSSVIRTSMSACPQQTGTTVYINGMRCSQAIQTLGKYLCYDYEYSSRECCQTCRRYKNFAKPACAYGDRITNCIQAYCSNTRMLQDCCETCSLRTLPASQARSTVLVNRGTIARTGQAVPLRTRPETYNPNCPYPDVNLYINGMTCSQAIQSLGKYLCYSYENRTRGCCEACQRLKNHGNPNCPYADQMTGCTAVNCVRGRERECCDTCEQQKRFGVSGCPYGDVSDFCYRVRPRDCSIAYNKELCCATCKRLSQSGVEGCPFGDEATNCARISAFECYQAYNQRVCCATCKRFDTGKSDCRYGDRQPGCSGMECVKGNVVQCCGTCNRLKASALAMPGCPYGDVTTDCARLTPEQCYYGSAQATNEQLCCATCKRMKIEEGECRYGDRNPTQCQQIGGSSCYYAANQRVCCKKCREIRRRYGGVPGCEYGDRQDHCASFIASYGQDQCANENTKQQCCYSCAGYVPTQPSPRIYNQK